MTNAFEHDLSQRRTQRSATRSRADFVYRGLRDAIADGRIGRGERVREEEIARNLGVSRTPVREALQRCNSAGCSCWKRRGLVVAELSQQQVIELYSMRQILEGSAAYACRSRARRTRAVEAVACAEPSRIWRIDTARDLLLAELGDAGRVRSQHEQPALLQPLQRFAHRRSLTRDCGRFPLRARARRGRCGRRNRIAQLSYTKSARERCAGSLRPPLRKIVPRMHSSWGDQLELKTRIWPYLHVYTEEYNLVHFIRQHRGTSLPR